MKFNVVEGRKMMGRVNSLERTVAFSRTESLVRKGSEMRAVVASRGSSSYSVRLPISCRRIIKFRHKESNL